MYTLNEVKKFCLYCKRCRLHKTRTKLVFGAGNEKADIMFVGEGPGFYEDKSGKPFVGAAGKLLTKMLNAININREETYITNIVKCRPPNNRNPLEDESEACLEYLRWQVKIIKPKIIVCLGAVSARNIINKGFVVSIDRGKWIKKGDFYIIATYHPAALLRDESKKKAAWDDFKSIRDKAKELNII